MKSQVSVVSKKPVWIKWAIIGAVSFVFMMTATVFLCMQQFDKAQNDPYSKVPFSSFGSYMAAVMDPKRQTVVVQALRTLTKYQRHIGGTKVELAASEAELRDVVDTLRSTVGADNEYTIMASDILAKCLVKEKKYAEAEKVFAEVVQINERICGPENRLTATAIVNLAEVNKDLRDWSEAGKLYERNLAIHRKYTDKNSTQVSTALEEIGNFHADKKDYTRAKEFYNKALDIHLARNDRNPSERRRMYEWLGYLEKRQKHPEESALQYSKAIDIEIAQGNIEEAADLHFNTGCGYADNNRYDKALSQFDEAEKLLAQVKSVDDEFLLASILEWKGWTLQRQKKFDESMAETQRAISLLEAKPVLRASEAYFRCLVQRGDTLQVWSKKADAEKSYKDVLVQYRKLKMKSLTGSELDEMLDHYYELLKSSGRAQNVKQIKSELRI